MNFPVTIATNLSRAVLMRVLAVVLLLGGLAAALDLAETAADILSREDGSLLRYLALRAPLILSSVAPVALIVGPVITFLTFSGRSEFTILRASGATTYLMMASLIPLAVAFGIGLYFLNDRIAPMMEGRLLAWLDDAPKDGAGAFWARTTTSVVHAESSAPAGDMIAGLEIYETNRQGLLLSRVRAEAARYDGEVWRFDAATRLIPGEGRSMKIDGETWETPLRPANVRALASPGKDVAGNVAVRMLRGDWASNRTTAYYKVRVYRGVSAALLPFVMILLAAPAAFGTRRAGGLGMRGALAVALGFCFLLFDGMLTALGETGNLPPILAAFGATAIFTAIGGYALISLEE